jgi:hypothetical protein
MQDEFLKQNKLVRPQIVRELTKRRNIKYIISVKSRNLLECAVDLIRTYWPTHVFDYGRDKIMVYYNYIDDVQDLRAILDYPTYTSESGTWEDKARVV